MVANEFTQSHGCGANVIALRRRTPTKNWRARVGALVDQAAAVGEQVKDGLLQDSLGNNGAYARTLIGEALDLCGRDTDVLLCGDPSDYYGWVVMPAIAMLIGARDMSDVIPSPSVALQPAIDALEEAARILDQADFDSL